MMEMLEKNQRAMTVWLVMTLLSMWSESVIGNTEMNEVIERNITTTESSVTRTEDSILSSAGETRHSGAVTESTAIISLSNSTPDVLAVEDSTTTDKVDPTTTDRVDSLLTMGMFANVRAEALDKVVPTVSQALTSSSLMHLSHSSSVTSPNETPSSSNTNGTIVILPTDNRDAPATSAVSSSKIPTESSISPSTTGQNISSSLDQLFTSSVSNAISSTKHTNYTEKHHYIVPTPKAMSSSTMKMSTFSSSTTPVATNGINSLYYIIIIIIVLLLILVFCLICVAKKKRRSGSTSFHVKKQKREDAWAGPVEFPEENGLTAEDLEEGKNKDQAGKNLTLTTFFGKRKSRQCSVLLEDVTVKVDQLATEEEKPLLNQEANGQMTRNEKSIEPPASSTSEPKPESESQPNGHVHSPKDIAPENKGESPSDLPSPIQVPAPDTDFPLPPSELEMIQDDEADKAC